MIVRLTGTLLDVDEEAVVIERDGVAREVLVPGFALGELTAHRGLEVTLHTLEFLEANAMVGNMTPRLVGFLYPEDRRFYHRFVSVKGIGARKALRALSEPVRRIAGWIQAGDAKSLATLRGIGKRAAEMIVAELRGKVDEFAQGETTAVVETARFTTGQRDALEVLLALGEARADAERWLERAAQLHPDLDEAEAWVKASYRIKTGVEG
ncbi:MAG TPA: helix-hairpin-helix domain-containing protein [Phycisphaerae bacterium]|nr:Holliday junction DNA helicase RuvA [Phycisphaerales bacterium]HRX85833.1 helix-hairpin-helix domain-containing protein [Phycisphaerae bacterium]